MIGRKTMLLESLINALLLLLQLTNILDGSLKYSALVLVTIWDEMRNLIDPLIDCLSATTFNCEYEISLIDKKKPVQSRSYNIPSLWLFLRTWCHSGEPTVGFEFMLCASRAAYTAAAVEL